ncbi:HD domain-containing protein [bacterium]|nr:HD domain-containing protein [bacterium]
MNQPEMSLVLRAAVFAAEAHVGQRRKGLDEPYINHPLRVAAAVEACGLPPEAVAAALLHDVVEDTLVTQKLVEAEFPARVAHLVRLMTKWWPDDAPAEVKREGNPKYYGALREDPDALVIKLLDRADNLRDMARMLPKARDWAARYLKKTELEFASLLPLTANVQARQRFEEAVLALRQALGK